MQVTGTSILAALKSHLDSNIADEPTPSPSKEVEKLWMQASLNLRRSQLMHNYLQEKLLETESKKLPFSIGTHTSHSNLINLSTGVEQLKVEYDSLVRDAEDMKTYSSLMSIRSDEQVSACQERLAEEKVRRELIQEEYSQQVATISKELDDFTERKRDVEREKREIIEKVSSLLNSIDSKEKSFQQAMQSIPAIDFDIFDCICREGDEVYEMGLEDYAAQVQILTYKEHKVSAELSSYSTKFDEIFTALEENKKHFNSQKDKNDKDNELIKKLVKVKTSLAKQSRLLEKRHKDVQIQQFEMDQTIEKSNAKLRR